MSFISRRQWANNPETYANDRERIGLVDPPVPVSPPHPEPHGVCASGSTVQFYALRDCYQKLSTNINGGFIDCITDGKVVANDGLDPTTGYPVRTTTMNSSEYSHMNTSFFLIDWERSLRDKIQNYTGTPKAADLESVDECIVLEHLPIKPFIYCNSGTGVGEQKVQVYPEPPFRYSHVWYTEVECKLDKINSCINCCVGRGGRERESKDPLTGCPGPQPPVTPLSGETDRSTLVFPVFGSNASTFFNGFSRSSPIVLPRIYYPQISEILYIENSTMVFDMREYFYGILLQRNNIPLEVNSDGSWINIGSGTPEYIRQICSIRCTTEVSAAANKVIELAQNHREEFGLGGPGSELTAEQVLSGYLTHYKNCQQAINGFINKCRDIRMVNRPDGGSGVGVGGGGAGRIYPPLRRDNRVPSGRVDPRLGDTLVRPRGPQ